MNSNSRNYDLKTPLIAGTAMGGAGTLLGPLGAIIGFVVGAGLGLWLDYKPALPAESSSSKPLENSVKRTFCR